MRAGYLDALRGLAVIWMIIFHACYDLRTFNLVHWNFSEGFWYAFPRFIAFTFLFCVGVSLSHAHSPVIKWQALWDRTLKLGVSAGLISLATYFLYPGQWIYFGTLHCILVGSFLGALMVNHKRASLLLLIVLLVLQYGLDYDIAWVSSVLKKPSMDFIPIYPWFWVILLGTLTGPLLSKNKHLCNFEGPKLLKRLGRHSLKIYLLHQPLLYGLIWIIWNTL